MVFINNKRIEVYYLDTDKSVLERIAGEFNTLPDFVRLKNPITSENNKADDILKFVKDASFEELKDKYGKPSVFITKTWLAFNINFNKEELDNIIIDEVGSSMVSNDYFKNKEAFNTFWNKKEAWRKDIENKIDINKKRTEKLRTMYKTFEKIGEDGWVYTNFTSEKITISSELNTFSTTSIELFNSILLNEKIPFATYKDYFKILKEFTPPTNWAKESETLQIKMYNKKNINDISNAENYMDVNIDDNNILQAKLNTTRDNIVKEDLISNILGIFQEEKIEIINTKETELAGYFYFPKVYFNTYVFSDLCMNDIFFSALIDIDESIKPTKKKGNEDNLPWLYLTFTHELTGTITASVSQKFVDRSMLIMKDTDDEIFSQNSPYIRVRVKGTSIQRINIFIDIFSKLLVIYDNNYADIVKYYKKFIPDFGIVKQEEIILKKKEQLKAPDVFISSYSRQCEILPIVIDKSETKEYEEKGLQVIKFPRDKPIDASAEKFPSDGTNQKYYVCLDPVKKYPGIQQNKLANSSYYPFVPCCFRTDQTEKKTGIYTKYYKGIVNASTKTKQQQQLISTDKILKNDQLGQLPSNIEKIFRIIEPDLSIKFVRLGMFRNTNSFINAIATGMFEKTRILNIKDEAGREKKLEEIRTTFLDEKIIPLCKQSLYDFTMEEIRSLIKNNSVYLSPLYFCQLLESYFQCTIYLFDKEGLVLPRHVQGYYTLENKNRPTILVYQNKGSESDHAKYPQCELIIRWNTDEPDLDNNTNYFYDSTDKISIKFKSFFNIVNKAYTLNREINPIKIPDLKNAKEQLIDVYGKCRRIDYGTITVFFDPLPPLGLKITSSPVKEVSYQQAEEFIRTIGGSIMFQKVNNNKTMEIAFSYKSIKGSIPIIPINPISDLPIIAENVLYKETTSKYETFIENKKNSRYITEYTYWLFSKYLEEKKVQVSDKVFNSFYDDKMIIIPNKKYSNIKRTFSLESPVLKNGKLITVSEDMGKSLIFMLRLYYSHYPQKLINYKNNLTITEYYMDVDDFEKHSSQIVLRGEDSVYKWLSEFKILYHLTEEILIGTTSPYFFTNSLISDKIFLAKNANSLESALGVAYCWYNKGYAPSGEPPTKEKPYSFTLYSYKNAYDIEKFKIKGTMSVEKELRILGYKLNNLPFFTVLLDLE